MLNHSPTPWTIEPADEPEHREIIDSNLQCVATIYGPPEASHEGPEQNQLFADARLIQTAPQMYELLARMATESNHDWFFWQVQIENLLNDIEEN